MKKFSLKNFDIKKLNGIFSSLICIAIGLIILVATYIENLQVIVVKLFKKIFHKKTEK